MPLKSFVSRYRSLLALIVALAVIVISAATSTAAPKSFKLGVRLGDNYGCAPQGGPWKYTSDATLTSTGLMPSLWTYDNNAYDPDCMQLDLKATSGTLSSDFRVCIQFADGASLDRSGNLSYINEVGSIGCTPWATDGGGWSTPVGDANWYDWDVVQVAIETRAMPAGKEIIDYRVGGQLCDHGCSKEYGNPQFTGWASQGGGMSEWFADANWYDSDGGRLYLDAILATPLTCKEPLPENQQVKYNPSRDTAWGGLGNKGAPSGWITKGTDVAITSLTLKNGFNDREVEAIYWKGLDNFFVPGGEIVRVPYAGNKQIVYCPTNYVVVGLDTIHNARDDHETALLCRPIIAGSIDFSAAKEYSINGCGAKYCDPYYNFPTAGVVMVGGRFNTDNHKYLGSIVVAPVLSVTDKMGPCSACGSQPGIAYFKTDGNETYHVDPPAGVAAKPGGIPGNPVFRVPSYSASWLNWRIDSSNDGSGMSWIYSESYPLTGSNGKDITFTEKVTLPAGAVANKMTFTHLADDILKEVRINGTALSVIPSPAPTCTSGVNQWSSTNSFTLPARMAKNLLRPGENKIEAVLMQCGGPAGIAFKGTIEYTTPPTDPSCSACVEGGRELFQPLVTSEATPVKAAGQVIGMECLDNKLPIAVATAYSSKKIVAGTCVATTPGFFSSTNRTFVSFTNLDQDYRCPAGSVITRFVETGMMCQPISGGASSLLMGTARKVAIGTGSAVNNYFSLAQNGSSKVWAPIGVEHKAGSPEPKNVTVVEVNTAPSCTRLPPPVTGAINVRRFVRNADGTPGQPVLNTKAGLNASNLVSEMPAVFLQLAPGTYPIYVTDLPGEERFGFCSFTIGGNPCAPTSYAPIPSGLCSAGTCQVPPTEVAGGKVASVVVTYASTSPVVPPPPPPIPDPTPDPDPNPTGETCTLTATPATIVINVGSSKLEWNCSGSGTVTLSATNNPAFTSVSNLPMQGSLNVSPDRTTTFKVTSSGASATVTVNVGGSTIDENWEF